MPKTEWLLCPTCGGKTRDRIRQDTILINYPLYCPKCKQEHLISLSSTTHNYRNIDKNKQKWYNRSARKKAEKSKKACT